MGNSQGIIFHTLFRPPNVSKTNFIGKLNTLVECAALTSCENIILGDLNLHLDKWDVWLQKFNDSLCQCNFTQIIDSPTYIHSRILDILCVRDTFSEAGCSPTILPSLSLLIYLSRLPANSSRLTRKNHRININDFRGDILNPDLIKHPHKTASLLSHQYFKTLCSILDRHAPVNRKQISLHPDKGFMN